MNGEPSAIVMLDREQIMLTFSFRTTRRPSLRCTHSMTSQASIITLPRCIQTMRRCSSRQLKMLIGFTLPPFLEGQTERGVAERVVRSVKEGGRAVLLTSGLNETFWTYAIRHVCFLRNTRRFQSAPGNRAHSITHHAYCRRQKGHAYRGQRGSDWSVFCCQAGSNLGTRRT